MPARNTYQGLARRLRRPARPGARERLDEYRDHLGYEGKRAATIESYVEDVHLWLRWCEEQGLDPFAIERADLRTYVDALRLAGKKPSTLKRRVGGTVRWYAWLAREGFMASNPLDGFKLPRSGDQNPLPKVLTPDEAAAVVAAPQGDAPHKVRDRALLWVLYSSGIRLAEVVALDVGDVNLKARQLRVRDGKGGRARVAFLSRDAARALREYLERGRPALLKGSTEALWITERGSRAGRAGGRVSRTQVRKLVRQCGEAVGVAGLHPHALRHTCASTLFAAGVDLFTVQRLLGHRSVVSTQRYVTIGDDKLRQEADAAWATVERQVERRGLEAV